MDLPDPQIEKPKANALIVADAIYRDVLSAKWILAGVFNRILAPALPVVQDMAVFFQVTNVSKPVDLRLRIEQEEAGELLLDFGGPISAESPLEVIERNIQLRGMKFPAFGKYWVQLVSREEILIRAPVYVKPVPEEEPDEPTSDSDD